MTTTSRDSVTDGSTGDNTKAGVSDFLTVQSFTNFAAVSGAITAAWQAVQTLNQGFFGLWFPLRMRIRVGHHLVPDLKRWTGHEG